MAEYDDGVFLNVPFDKRYTRLFYAIVFAVHTVDSLPDLPLRSTTAGRPEYRRS
jgi:hypothetical protein